MKSKQQLIFCLHLQRTSQVSFSYENIFLKYSETSVICVDKLKKTIMILRGTVACNFSWNDNLHWCCWTANTNIHEDEFYFL